MNWFTTTTDPRLFRCCDRPECDAPQPSGPLLDGLNRLRERLGRPIIVTSGPRCKVHNAEVGGADGSDHLVGNGADLEAPTSRDRWHLIAANFEAQTLFRRLGVGKTFVHVGVGSTPDVIWTYYL